MDRDDVNGGGNSTRPASVRPERSNQPVTFHVGARDARHPCEALAQNGSTTR